MNGFSVRGLAADGEEVVVSWRGDGGFDDPTGAVAVLIATGEQVCATATGPCFAAAAAPGHVALLTALAALAEVREVTGAEALVRELRSLAEVPAGAVS